ncbi:MAG: hypothetical protein WBU20_14345, partial [Candidatus Acidiferrum sp.]
NSSPDRNGWRIVEVNAATAPLLVLASNILRDEPDAGVAVDQRLKISLGRSEGKTYVRIAIGRTDLNPASSVGKRVVNGHGESELLGVEPEAAVEISHVHDRKMQAQIRILAI